MIYNLYKTKLMSKQDIRWIQRFQNFQKALDRLLEIVAMAETKDLTEIEQDAMIQRFEYTQELSWNVIKDFYIHQGKVDIQGAKDAYRLAFKRGLITDGQLYMDMVTSRNRAAHTYNQETANEVAVDIIERYATALEELKKSILQKAFTGELT